MLRFFAWALSAFVFGIAAMAPALITYWCFQPSPVTYSSRTILTPEVPPGGELRIKIEASVVKNGCRATVHRSVVDSTGREMPFVEETRPAYTDYVVKLTVPLGAAPGFARYRAVVEWRCNPVQELFPNTVLQPELYFRIVPADGQTQVPEQQGIYQAPMIKSELAEVKP